jgi:ferredoxin
LETQQVSEHGVEPAILRRDEDLRDLLLIHLQGATITAEESERASGGQVPALLGAYRDLDSLRYDYPIVLFDNDVDTAMATLAGMVDEMLRKADARQGADDDLRRQVYRLEAEVKKALSTGHERDLSRLWAEAAQRLPGPLARVGPLGVEGRVVGCGPDTAREVIEHLWGMLRVDAARAERLLLDDLASRLSDILEVDRASSQRSTSAEALRNAMADQHAAGIDFDALAKVLRTGQRRVRLPLSRRQRIRGVLKTIDATRTRLARQGGNGSRRSRSRSHGTPCKSSLQALGRAREALAHRVHLSRAVRVARLELDNRYREQRHDAYFAAFDATQLSPHESRALPPELICLNADALDEQETLALLDLLASDLPVKVLLQLRELPSRVEHFGSPGAPATVIDHAAALAMSMGEVFVLQSTVAHLPGLGAELVAGLRYPGPALFCIYAAGQGGDAELPGYLRAAAAIESRAMPGFVYDPSRGADSASRFALVGNPQPQDSWPRHELGYEEADGRESREELAFTCIDFLALDARLSGHFTVVPRERWHPGMVPIADYLELPPEQAMSHVPYVYLVDAEDRLQRAVVTRELVAHGRRCASRWRRLQELAGIGSAHAQRLLAEQQARLEADKQRAIEELRTTLQGAPPVAEPRPGGAPASREDTIAEVAVEMVEEAAPPAERDDAWIDSDLCTSCDDCTRRNPKAFAYNEARQAYLKDAGAASYRELVEAAEECPVCIIHPGKPLNPDEPGIEELMKRAEPFA